MLAPRKADDGLISKRLLSSSVYERMLEDIVTGRYDTGERLDVNAIADELGVSRTPVREAIQRLSMTQFVSIARNSRTEVAQWCAEDMRDRIEILNKLLDIALSDPRAERAALAAIAETFTTRTLGSDVTADVHLFLNFAERLIASSPNRIGSHDAAELITPLRMFFREDVLHVHHIDIGTEHELRQYLLTTALDAATKQNVHHVVRSLDSYFTLLGAAVSPRADDLVLDPRRSLETEQPILHAVQ